MNLSRRRVFAAGSSAILAGAVASPFVARAQMLANVQSLINTIQSTVEPSYWQPNGPGSIAFFEPTMSITIRASAEMHYQLGGTGRYGMK